MRTLYLGLDVGGTHTRAAVVDHTRQEHGRARTPGANPAARGRTRALHQLTAAATRALSGADARQIAACVIGLSGYRSLIQPQAFAEQFATLLGLRETPALLPDTVTSFASGTSAPSGTVLIAGTGAVCSRVAHTRVTHTEGGLGWLLGDEGAGFWLGREALRVAHRRPVGPLATAVLQHCRATEPDALVQWAYTGPRRRLAALAPLVSTAAALGDPQALELAATAADHLAALVRRTAHPGSEPLVLAGSVATTPGPIRDLLVNRLEGHYPLSFASDPALAAAHLATTAPRAGSAGPSDACRSADTAHSAGRTSSDVPADQAG